MIVRESFRRDAARLVIWYPVRWFIRFMPVRTAFAFFRCLGDLQRWLGKKSLHGLKKNIHRALPDHPQPSAVLKRYLRNHYVDRLHIFTYPRLRNPGVLETICRIAGLENLHQALAAGRGAIIVLGHYGPIQLPLFHLGLSGYSIVQVGLPTD
ncbi:MAG TPA: lauroyl acyltransferase, partial [bacterium]|nr:lauroyl acyltransferase [bacterium]